MSGSQPCKHAWLAGREVVVSASVRRTLECSQDSVACLLSESMEIGSLYGFSGSSRDMRTAGRLNFATNRRIKSVQPGLFWNSTQPFTFCTLSIPRRARCTLTGPRTLPSSMFWRHTYG